MNTKETKKNIIQAGHVAVEELIKVAKEAIVDSDDDISADRLKNAAATKKLAIFDAFEILNRIEEEENVLNNKPQKCRELNNCDLIQNGGWHLSYFGDINFIKNKLQNFSHIEYNTQQFRDNDHIKKCILDCKDLFNRNDTMQYIEFVDNINLPPNYEFFIKNV